MKANIPIGEYRLSRTEPLDLPTIHVMGITQSLGRPIVCRGECWKPKEYNPKYVNIWIINAEGMQNNVEVQGKINLEA